MEKKKNLSKIIAAAICGIALTVIAIASTHQSAGPEGNDNGDTVAASVFEPQTENEAVSIDLQKITSIRFPKYKVVKATPFVPDSVSLAADEETVASGNYTATLLLDTVPGKVFYENIDLAAQHDSCWSINKFAYSYEHKDKAGGLYKIVFSKGSLQILVTHQNR